MLYIIPMCIILILQIMRPRELTDMPKETELVGHGARMQKCKVLN